MTDLATDPDHNPRAETIARYTHVTPALARAGRDLRCGMRAVVVTDPTSARPGKWTADPWGRGRPPASSPQPTLDAAPAAEDTPYSVNFSPLPSSRNDPTRLDEDENQWRTHLRCPASTGRSTATGPTIATRVAAAPSDEDAPTLHP